MSAPALALVPVLPASTGTGANTGPAWCRGHRHHAVRENTDGNKESGEPGRFAGRPCPGVPLFPLFFHPATLSCQHVAEGCP
jgi:hypothetical protein